MTYKVYCGAPEESDGRLDREMRVYRMLSGLGIEFQRVDHEAVPTMEACRGIDQALGIEMCKNLFLTNAQKTKFYLLLMPGDKKFKTKDLSKQIQSARLSFAGEEYMKEYLDILPGAVSIMGLMNDTGHNVQLLIDRDIAGEEYLGCHPCVNTSSIRVAMKDILEKVLPYTGHTYQLVEL